MSKNKFIHIELLISFKIYGYFIGYGKSVSWIIFFERYVYTLQVKILQSLKGIPKIGWLWLRKRNLSFKIIRLRNCKFQLYLYYINTDYLTNNTFGTWPTIPSVLDQRYFRWIWLDIYLFISITADGLLVPEGIMHPVVSIVSKWYSLL